MVAATVLSATAQIKSDNNTSYGIAVSQFTSGSGFQPGYEAHFTVQPSAKSKVGFGLFLDNETKKISGLTITHQRMLMANRRNQPFLQPFIFYNFIYRKTSIPELRDATETTGIKNIATYTSMEHHLGIGLNINISKNIIVESGLGYGLYLGSIKRPSSPDPITKEISGTSGNALIFKTGIGFSF
jgi:hypothetical protein